MRIPGMTTAADAAVLVGGARRLRPRDPREQARPAADPRLQARRRAGHAASDAELDRHALRAQRDRRRRPHGRVHRRAGTTSRASSCSCASPTSSPCGTRPRRRRRCRCTASRPTAWSPPAPSASTTGSAGRRDPARGVLRPRRARSGEAVHPLRGRVAVPVDDDRGRVLPEVDRGGARERRAGAARREHPDPVAPNRNQEWRDVDFERVRGRRALAAEWSCGRSRRTRAPTTSTRSTTARSSSA